MDQAQETIVRKREPQVNPRTEETHQSYRGVDTFGTTLVPSVELLCSEIAQILP
jgi:hypothetical protein